MKADINEEMNELRARLDDLAGMQLALAQLVGLALTAHPQKAAMKAAMPSLDQRLAAIHLNSTAPDRVIEVAEQTWQRMTLPFRDTPTPPPP